MAITDIFLARACVPASGAVRRAFRGSSRITDVARSRCFRIRQITAASCVVVLLFGV